MRSLEEGPGSLAGCSLRGLHVPENGDEKVVSEDFRSPGIIHILYHLLTYHYVGVGFQFNWSQLSTNILHRATVYLTSSRSRFILQDKTGCPTF